MKYIVKEDSELLNYLYIIMKDISKKKIKSLLKYKNIIVNNKEVTKFDYKLKKGDLIYIKEYKGHKVENNNIDIIYEDKDIIVVNKKSGLLTIATDKEKEITLYRYVSDYVKMINKKNNIYIIHRLDKDTSGIVMFAKNEKIKKLYQDNWNDLVMVRSYIAIVEGNLEKKEDTIKSYLKENKNNLVYSTKDKNGKIAITNYKVLKENSEYSMLQVIIETGRKNQIRVHMKDIKHPIIGDKKYGSKNNSINRLGLHANKLVVINPLTKKEMVFETNIPRKFKYLLKK